MASEMETDISDVLYLNTTGNLIRILTYLRIKVYTHKESIVTHQHDQQQHCLQIYDFFDVKSWSFQFSQTP